MSGTPDEFDVIVIGGGPAGETVAGRCAAGGLAVALVEQELVGGECSYWGCIPSKTLIRPGDVLAAARRTPGAAQAITQAVDAEAAFGQRDYMTSHWSDAGQKAWLDGNGIGLLRGHGRLAGPRLVEIESADGTRRVRARRAVVVAAGTVPAMPPIPGLDTVAPWDNRSATSAHAIPASLLVLGGGAIGVEMTQTFRRLGSDPVTLLEGRDRLLSPEEPFAGEEVRAALEAEGVTVVTGARVATVRRDTAGGAVIAGLEDGREYQGDELLVAVGRRPATADIGLEAVGLDPGAFLGVDDAMRVAGADGWLFAVGDCNGRALLTHMGKYQGRLAADAILGRDLDAVPAAEVVPRVTFTDPQVAAVGMTEAEAHARGLDVDVVSYRTGDVAGAATLGRGITGTSKLVIDRGRRTVVGATFVGPGIGDLLHSATIAIVGQVPVERLWHAVPSFPTLSEVWLRLLEAYGL